MQIMISEIKMMLKKTFLVSMALVSEINVVNLQSEKVPASAQAAD